MPRKPKRRESLEEANRAVDQRFAREDLAGVLRAGSLLTESRRERAKLIEHWLTATERSGDVGGPVGLDQPAVQSVLEAARSVLELAESTEVEHRQMDESAAEFCAEMGTARPLSTLAAGAAIAAWNSTSLGTLIGGLDRLHFGWPDFKSNRPWLQVVPAFLIGEDAVGARGAVQYEIVAESWDESERLAGQVESILPLSCRTALASLTVAKSDLGGMVAATFDEWALCRTILTVDVRLQLTA